MEKTENTTVEREINRLVKFVKQRLNPEKIFLFGSYAKGNPEDESDIDFFIVQKTDLPKHKRSIPLYKGGRMKISRKSVDFIVYTPEEFKIWSQYKNSIAGEVLETGKLLYEK